MFYESTFIARQDISEQDVAKLTEKFSGVVEKNDGKIVKSEYWGLRNLSYPINKGKKGHYVHLGIEGSGKAAKAIDKSYGLSEDVIRNLTIKVEEISKEPSAIMRNDDDDSFAPDISNDDSSDN